MIQKIILITLSILFSTCFSLVAVSQDPHHQPPTIQGHYGLILDLESGKAIFQKHDQELIYPASMTKIATALYILTHHRDILDKTITARKDFLTSIAPEVKKQSKFRSPPHWLETDGSSIHLQPKEEMSGLNLLYALLVGSANDAANVLAGSCAPSIPAFMTKVNQFLRELGCHHTHFNNPHGLHHPDHITTAHDLAIMLKHALQDPLFQMIISTSTYTIPATNLEKERVLTQTNKLIQPKSPYYYPQVLGGKTGTTSYAGKNIVISAANEQRALIIVLGGHKGSAYEFYHDIRALCDYGLKEPLRRHYFIHPGSKVPISWMKLHTHHITLPEGVFYDFYPSNGLTVSCVRFKQEKLRYPVSKGSLIGQWLYLNDRGGIVTTSPLFASEDLESPLSGKKLTRYCIQLLRLSLLLTILFLWIKLGQRIFGRRSRYSRRR